MAQHSGLQPGESVSTAGAAERNRNVVVDQLAAAAGEDRRTVGKARAVLLADAGGRTPDESTVLGDVAQDCAVADTDGIGGSWSSRQRNPSIN